MAVYRIVCLRLRGMGNPYWMLNGPYTLRAHAEQALKNWEVLTKAECVGKHVIEEVPVHGKAW